MDRPLLRQKMRRQRQSLSVAARRTAANAIARRILRARLLRPGYAIGVYAAFDGEVDLGPLTQFALRAGCSLYAPRIVNFRTRKMKFESLRGAAISSRASGTSQSIRSGRGSYIDPRRLDVILIPLVAFDMHGWRLGFGAGFYDRQLAFMRRRIRNKPLLVGVGYEFQRVAPQEPEPWDVLIHAVVTEHGLHRCRRRSKRTFLTARDSI